MRLHKYLTERKVWFDVYENPKGETANVFGTDGGFSVEVDNKYDMTFDNEKKLKAFLKKEKFEHIGTDSITEAKKLNFPKDIISFLGKPPRTWFEIEDQSSTRISLVTRQHGDVSDDRPGREDIREASRLVKELRKRFSKIAKITADSVDEWVMVDIIKK
jgi:hypothetical protein